MVRLPSPSGAERAVADAFVAALAPHAASATVDEVGNAVALVGHGPVHVTLLAHLDTAPGWPPVRLEDGVLWGRGTVDAKGPAVALAAAAARMGARARAALSVRFVGAVGEESSASRGARHARLAYPRPDVLIVGEPSGWDGLTLGYKGHARMRLRAERAAGHAARDEATAPENLVAAWLALRTWAETATPAAADPGRVFDRLQPALLTLRSDHDGLCDRAEAHVDWRLPPGWPPERLRDALTRVPRPPGVAWTLSGHERAVRGARDGALARAFRTAIRAAGGTPAVKVKTGTSDWNVVESVWDVDTLAYGPGDAALDHAPDERLDLRHLDRAVRVLAHVFGSLAAAGCGGVRAPTARSSS